jgi:hypothetical protein
MPEPPIRDIPYKPEDMEFYDEWVDSLAEKTCATCGWNNGKEIQHCEQTETCDGVKHWKPQPAPPEIDKDMKKQLHSLLRIGITYKPEERAIIHNIWEYIEDLQAQLKEAKNQRDLFKTDLNRIRDEKWKITENLQKELQAKEDTINSFSNAYAVANNRIKHQKLTIEAKDQEVIKLAQRFEEVIAKYKKRHDQQQAEIANRDEEIAISKKAIEFHTKEIEAKDQEIERLEEDYRDTLDHHKKEIAQLREEKCITCDWLDGGQCTESECTKEKYNWQKRSWS